MTIHLLAPKDRSKWNPIWHKCYNIWESGPYEVKLWGDEDVDILLKEDDEEFYNKYLNQLDPIYKFDLVRYIILEKYGGAYFDMDVEINFDFIPLLDLNEIYFAEGEDNCIVSNHIIISPIDYLYWYNIRQELKLKLINKFDKAKKNPFWTLETVGPIGLSYVLATNKYKYTPLSKWHFGSMKSKLQFCIHHTTHNWTKNNLAHYEI
jgi:mannosyltransferase OCH1-like enzyme